MAEFALGFLIASSLSTWVTISVIIKQKEMYLRRIDALNLVIVKLGGHPSLDSLDSLESK